jgi:glucose-1-phosphate thymidylyltransferase
VAQSFKPEFVGLVPAGGQATRISPLPCSKELYPIGFGPIDKTQTRRPKVVSHYLLEKMKAGGVHKVYFVLRPGKWDIPAYYGDGTNLGMSFAYLMLGVPYGVPFTLDQAYPFVRNATVAFGFPDILFDADEGFSALYADHLSTGADISLGMFPATDPLSLEDRVIMEDHGLVRDILLRPPSSDLPYSWAIAVWSPKFTDFLHQYVEEKKTGTMQIELSAGHAIQAAIRFGLHARGIILGQNPYIDIGTPDGLCRAVTSTYHRL